MSVPSRETTSHPLSNPTVQRDIVALVVVHLHIQHSTHALAHVHGEWVLETETTLIPVRSRGIRSSGENDLRRGPHEVHVEPARETVEES